MANAVLETLFDHEADYVPSKEVAAVAAGLLERHEIVRINVEDLRVAYLERLGERSGEGEEAIAKCQKAGPLWRDLAGYDVVIWTWAEVWQELEPRQREALVLHELLHVGRNSQGGVKLRKHDLEEFAMVVLHYGAWDDAVSVFGKALRRYEIDETRVTVSAGGRTVETTAEELERAGRAPIRLPAGRERRRPGSREKGGQA